MTSNDDTFLTTRISNSDLYQEMKDMRKEIQSLRELQEQHYKEIVRRQDFTNGKVKMLRLVATGFGTAIAALWAMYFWLADKLLR